MVWTLARQRLLKVSSGRALKNVEKNKETHVIERLASRKSQSQGGGTYGLAEFCTGMSY